jgi:Flp pilus assembly protein TadG
LEFAAIAPLLLLMIIGAFDIARAITIWQQTMSAAQDVAISAQSLAVQPDSSTSLTDTQGTLAMTTIYGAMPQIKSGLYSGIYSVTLSGINYSSAATPVASIVWSTALTEGNGNLQKITRSCGTVTQVAAMPEDASTMTVIPTLNISTQTTLVVADVHYQFTPLFFNFITGPIDFWESYAFPTLVGQNAQAVCYGAVGDVAQCPGYTASLCLPASGGGSS